jgi:hypothetical protein
MLLAVYGLGTCLSAPLVCLGCMVVLVSMLLAGDGQVTDLTVATKVDEIYKEVGVPPTMLAM